MASLGGSAETHGAPAAVSICASKLKVKRTPVILNNPRRLDVAHFKVLQWNVLADGLAQNGDFCMTPPGCLEWEYRRPLLLQEIEEADADIICLQELNHFDELNAVLADRGYAGAFRAKYASPALKYEYPPDGMAVFYRRDRFRVCEHGGVEGRSFTDDSTGREQSQGFLQVLLYDMVVDRQLLVVTTHLKAKDGEECESVRLGQARQLLGHIDSTLQRLSHGAGDGDGRGERNGGSGSNNGNGRGGNGTNGAVVIGGGGSNGNGAPGGGGGGPAGSHNGNGKGCHSGTGGNGSVGGSGGVTVIVAGDFNTMPGSKTCQAFRQHPLGLHSLWEQRPLDSSIISCSGSDLDLPLVPYPAPHPPWPGPGPRAGPGQQQPPPRPQVDGAAEEARGPSPPPPPPQQQLLQAAAALVSGDAQEGAGGGGAAAASWRPEFSTWKFRVKGESKRISDYIWFSGVSAAGGGGGGVGGGALRPLTRWRMLTEEEIGPGALPSAAYGSDHVSLCCGFEWDVDVDLEWVPQRRAWRGHRSGGAGGEAEADDWG